MSPPHHYYEVLGLRSNASADEIKRAYRSLAKQWHPDRFPGDRQLQEEAEERFKEITAAYEFLKNFLESGVGEGEEAGEPEPLDRRAYAFVFYHQGEGYIDRGKYRAAIGSFSLAIEFDPEYIEAYRYRGFAYSQLGSENRARADFQKAESLKKRSGYRPNPEEPTPESRVPGIVYQRTIRYFQPIASLAIDRPGDLLAYSSHNYTIQLQDLLLDRTGATLRDSFPVRCLTVDARGERVFSGHVDGTIRVWHLKARQTEALGAKNTGHAGKVFALALTPDGARLISGGSDRTVRIWALNGRCEPRVLTGYATAIASIAISSDGKYFVAAGLEPRLRIREVVTGQIVRSMKTEAGIVSIAFSPDSQLLATAGVDRSLRLWHVKTGREIWNFTGHLDRVSSIVFTPDGQTLISGSWDTTIKFWSLVTKEEIGSLDGHSDRVLSLAMSADGTILLSGSSDRTVKIWKNERS
ncbi:DnaJ domain-containing protein [Pannus brasiliensis CCIBt3594]|uniref:DnaJ domain-containing protein n=1 Tax=Pannus brasiliensis CCIBt3594 TaxID=1427578 RepID=A0AAW9QP55_9CHRO